MNKCNVINNKEDILNIFKEKNIITQNNKRKFCWKKYWDNESEEIFNKFKQNYRTENEAWFCLLNNVKPYHCEICGELAKFTGTKKTKYPGYTTTCDKCSSNLASNKLKKFSETIKNRTDEDKKKIVIKRKQTNLKKYGDQNYMLFGSQSFKDNLKEKYGNDHYNNREKYKETCLEKYGVTCNLALNASERVQRIWNERKEEIIQLQVKNSLNKYGYKSPNQHPNIIKKQKEGLIKHYGSLENAYKQKYELSKLTKLEKYGDENYHNKEQILKTLENKHLIFEKENNCIRYSKVLELYGQGWQSLNIPIIYNGRFRYVNKEYIPIIEKYSKEYHNVKCISNQEKELLNYIKTCTSCKVKTTVKNLIKDNDHTYDLDIYIPELHIAFEYNGIYWHSNFLKDKYYHQNKTKLCYDKNIQLIHIWEYDWINKKEQIKQQIKELLSGKNCSKYNWVSVNDYQNYILSEPEEIHIGRFTIFNEGKFIKK